MPKANASSTKSTPYENPKPGTGAIVRKQNEQGSPVIALLGTTPELDAMQATYPLKWATADTVEEVAGMVGLDGAKAKATVERYNGFCEAGKDEDCGTPADKMVPMTGPSTRSYRCEHLGHRRWLQDERAGSGPQARLGFQRLADRTDPRPVRRRRGGRPQDGHEPPGSCSMSDIYTFGRIAGKNAAAFSA